MSLVVVLELCSNCVITVEIETYSSTGLNQGSGDVVELVEDSVDESHAQAMPLQI